MDKIWDSKQLREITRMLERKLGALQDCQINCCSVTLSQCHALVEIGRAKNISLNELAQLLNLENSTMSRTVDKLVNIDLIKREISTKDRRYLRISLTEKGEKVFDNIEEDMNIYFEKVHKAIPESKREQVIESLQVLLEAITINKYEK
jgi:DNA-binding MarR family transcriptional regulator